jgi:hypothetical protein
MTQSYRLRPRIDIFDYYNFFGRADRPGNPAFRLWRREIYE